MADDGNSVENAWRIHGAIVTWTSGVDSKASFALAIESGAMAGVIGLAGGNRRLAGIAGTWENLCFYAGVAVLGVALVCVSLVVRPRLRTKRLKAESADNFIFFGHIRHWEAPALEAALRERDMLPVLTRQLINTSGVAWFKHRLLQLSMTLALVGVALITVTALMVG